VHVPDRGSISLRTLAAARRSPPCHIDRLFGDRARPFGSGRQALLWGLGMMRDPPRRVWAPAFICRAALAPVVRSGIPVSFYDIGETLEPLMRFGETAPGDAVLFIHYFGIMGPVASLRALGNTRGLGVIEDCAHGLPDPDAPMRMGSAGHLAIFSLRKQLLVPDGGVLMINDAAIDLPAVRPPARAPSGMTALRLAYNAVERFALASNWNILPLKDRLRRIGAFRHASGAYGAGRVGADPRDVQEASEVTLRILAVLDMPALIRRKKANYHGLAERLSGIRGVDVAVPELPPGSVPQVLPVRVADPPRMCRELRNMGVGASLWPGSDAVPDLALGPYPGAGTWTDRGLFLPVHECLEARHLDWMAQAVSRTVRGA
jgi:dTDP-4-amino-4,6-dideoxygalactose transaminase